MSELLEKVQGVSRLAIFPLPIVLLPYESLPLHIFESRYRQMLIDVEEVEEEKDIFGLSYFDASESSIDRPVLGSVGCAAEIKERKRAADGTTDIITQGSARYRILEYLDEGTPYLTARVEFFDDAEESVSEDVSDAVFELFKRVARAAFDLSGSRGRQPEIMKMEPEKLSFYVSAAFQLEPEMKYRLLTMTSTGERLTRLKGFLSQAVEKMEENAKVSRSARTNGHSKQKIDL